MLFNECRFGMFVWCENNKIVQRNVKFRYTIFALWFFVSLFSLFESLYSHLNNHFLT